LTTFQRFVPPECSEWSNLKGIFSFGFFSQMSGKERRVAMKRAQIAIFSALFFIAVMSFSTGPAYGAPKRVLIKLQQAYAKVLPVIGDGLVWWAEQVKEASDGQIVFKIYEPGKLVAPFEILDAVSGGKVDAGFAGAGFFAGKIPAAPIFSSIPYGPEADEYLAWMFYGNGLKLDQEMYDQAGYNVKVIPTIMLVPETSGWFSKPIESVKDLKGLKMRFYGYGGQAMQKLDVSVSLMPPAELFPALEKGVLDATEFSIPTLDERLGLHKIVKYNYFPGWHQQATICDLYINKDRWNSLSKSQQKLIEITSMASLMNSIAQGEATQAKAIRENVEKRDVKNMYWSEDMLEAFRKAWEEVAEEMAAKDPFFRKAYEDLQAFRKEYATWRALGFLPRNCQR
jgi:TRAP-type mannitol/chloroaromatic compound transport system substrate-binding protein